MKKVSILALHLGYGGIEKCIVKRKEAINYFKQTTNTSVANNYYYIFIVYNYHKIWL